MEKDIYATSVVANACVKPHRPAQMQLARPLVPQRVRVQEKAVKIPKEPVFGPIGCHPAPPEWQDWEAKARSLEGTPRLDAMSSASRPASWPLDHALTGSTTLAFGSIDSSASAASGPPDRYGGWREQRKEKHKNASAKNTNGIDRRISGRRLH